MKTLTSPVKLLGISGSLRRHSHTTAVLNTLSRVVKPKAQLSLFRLDSIPLYNADLDVDGPPESVASLKSAISECDGLVLCSPEYNYGMSGVLKNAIDWVSRPGFKSPLKGKPVLIMTASPGFPGGVRAQHQINDALLATLSRTLSRPQIAIANVHDKIVDGEFVDQPTIQLMIAGVDDLIAEIDMLTARQ